MTNAANPEKVQIEIPYGVVEYTAVFKKPILEAWATTALVISSTLEALGPFGFKLDGVEGKTHTEKLSEYAVVFKRSTPGVTLTLQLARLVLVAENLDWTEADKFIALAHAGINTILEKTKAEVELQHMALGFHVQLKNKPRREVMTAMLSEKTFELMDGEVQFSGIILQRDKASIVIDASLAFANGLFVRINREHPANVTLERIAEVLLADEKKLFNVLNLEETTL